MAHEILPKHGFRDILLTRTFCTAFPCDILAKKNGDLCAIEVTLKYCSHISKRLIPLMKFFNLRVFICHLKPDFSWYLLRELRGQTNSSCQGAFIEYVKKEAFLKVG